MAQTQIGKTLHCIQAPRLDPTVDCQFSFQSELPSQNMWHKQTKDFKKGLKALCKSALVSKHWHGKNLFSRGALPLRHTWYIFFSFAA
jgi:hypothetical protein